MSNPPPPLWFRLPPGYHSLDALDLSSLQRSASPVLTSLLEGTELLGPALRDVHRLTNLLAALRTSDTVHLSVGVHPDDEHGASVSFFSLSMANIATRPAGLAVAQCALAQMKSPCWNTSAGRLLRLPNGMPAALVAGTLVDPPRESLEELGIDKALDKVFQARLTIPCPSGEHIAVADLTSAAVRNSEAYTSILEGIGLTMSFSSPVESAAPVPQPTSRIRDLF
ncbi:hypothetical protein [Streptomyces sp. NPDC014894]|uniref:hypothetical protein n=1 Tax=Streptomyces sp. NPDC014894 TaxID=3364931 RepID=UPI0036FB0A1D